MKIDKTYESSEELLAWIGWMWWPDEIDGCIIITIERSDDSSL